MGAPWPLRGSCTSSSAIVTMTATSYAGLYVGHVHRSRSANGAVEAVVNPVTATLYPNSRTHHLNMLHAGWPGGLVIGGMLAIAARQRGRRKRLALEGGALSHPHGHLRLHDARAKNSPCRSAWPRACPTRKCSDEFGWAGCLIVVDLWRLMRWMKSCACSACT